MVSEELFCEREFWRLIRGSKAKEAMEYAEKHTPDYLYKYYSLSGNNDELDKKKLESLKNNCNWFDLSKNQNDPLDMRMAYVKEDGASQVSMKQIESAKELMQKLSECFVLCSFTSAGEFDLPMWHFYTNQHRGYCIKYKVNCKKAVFRILYNMNRVPVLNMPLQLMALCEDAEKKKSTDEDNADLELYRYVMLLLLNTKHVSWEHEKEFRLIHSVKTSQGRNFENEKLGIQPVCVYVGMHCDSESKKALKEICDKNLKCDCLQAISSKDKILDFARL